MGDAVAMPRLEAATQTATQMVSAALTESHPAVPPASHSRMPGWMLGLVLLGAGGGGGGIAAVVGSLGGGDLDALSRVVERQDERIDQQDEAIERLEVDQAGQHRWVASELIKQSRALARIAEKLGAEVDVAVEPYQSGGM